LPRNPGALPLALFIHPFGVGDTGNGNYETRETRENREPGNRLFYNRSLRSLEAEEGFVRGA